MLILQKSLNNINIKTETYQSVSVSERFSLKTQFIIN
jgi:hypothetical protein